jgi:hypothetical protein
VDWVNPNGPTSAARTSATRAPNSTAEAPVTGQQAPRGRPGTRAQGAIRRPVEKKEHPDADGPVAVADPKVEMYPRDRADEAGGDDPECNYRWCHLCRTRPMRIDSS